MFFFYMVLGAIAGAVGSLFLFFNDGSILATLGTFVIVSQIIFWGGLSLNIAYDRIGRRFIGLLNDSDIVSNPAHILETNASINPKMRCLVVDDDEISLQIMKEMLVSLGHTDVITCISGHDALDVLDRSDKQFDCLLLDIEMPTMGGDVLCGVVRAQPAFKDVPIIMVTAKTGREHVKAAFRAGATDYITKPYSESELASRLSAMQVKVNKDRPFDGVDRFISLTAMDNFLLQIERGGLFATNVLTIKVEGFELFQKRASTSEVKSFLREFAVSTLASLSDTDALVAYAGKGILACVTTTRSIDVASLETQISEHLFDQRDAGMPRNIGQANVTVSAMQNISLQEREGESVFRLHCKIYDASEPQLRSARSRKRAV
jgi:CheY-like chemotaxis protein